MKTKFDSYNLNGLPKGCKYCVRGEKAVLFLGGKCSRSCWYCSLSDSRKKMERAFINEREIKRTKDLVEEIKASKSIGVGITGGDPLVYLSKTLKFSKILKDKFGKKFHIHVYLPLNLVTENTLKKLSKNIDEVRFHPTFLVDNSNEILEKEKIKQASKFFGKNNVGIEVPMLPEKKKEIYNFVYSIKENIGFVNLNEFEISETNFIIVTNKYKLNEDTYTISESKKAGRWILDKAKKDGLKLKFHLCTAKTKDFHQYKNRLLRHKILPFGNRLCNGNVVYFVIYEEPKENLIKIKKLTKNYFYDKERKRIILKIDDVLKVYENLNLRIAKVEEQPVFGNERVSLEWIGE